VISGTPYRFVYRVDEQVVILDIRHSRRKA